MNQNYANILLMLLRLRQACDHPLLVKGFSSDSVGSLSSETVKRLPKQKLQYLLGQLETSLAICGVCNVSSIFIVISSDRYFLSTFIQEVLHSVLLIYVI